MDDRPRRADRWSFMWRPRWILSHVLVLALIVTMVLAGFWQLDRLREQRDLNERIERRAGLPVEPVGALVGADPDGVEYRPVSAEGEYVAGADVRVSNRTLEGVPGDWVISLLELDGGATVAVNRGFVARGALADVDGYAPPRGSVSVEGHLRETATGGAIGTPEAALEGAPPEINRVDLDLIGEMRDRDLGSLWIQLGGGDVDPAAAVAEGPVPVPLPELDDGPHLEYAVQWFLFTVIAVIGYPLVLRRIARADERRGDTAPSPD